MCEELRVSVGKSPRPIACPTAVWNHVNLWVTLGAGELTWQSSQHSPCAHTASGFRVQVVALQQRFMHSWRGEGDSFDRITGATSHGKQGGILSDCKREERTREPGS